MRNALFLSFALLFVGLLTITCGTRDDRDKIRADFGEPDRIVTQGIDPFWRETWFYDSIGVAFEFRRTSGCGSFRDVYLFQQYAYVPVPSDSTGNRQHLPLVPSRNPVIPY